MDLSKPDTLCVYCGSNLESVPAEELAKGIHALLSKISSPRPVEIARAILSKYEVRRK